MTKACYSGRITKCQVFGIASGFALILLGIISAVTRMPQNMVDQQFRKHLIISMDSPTYDDWLLPPTPVYMDYYLFNVTNADDVINGAKPNLEQHGPYSYAMHLPRFDVSFYTNSTVSFRFNHTLIFQPHRSGGKEDDIIHHLNMPLVTVAGMVKQMSLSPGYSKIFAKVLALIGEKDLVVPHTAKEILFGYVDPFFNALNELLALIGFHYDPMFAPFYKFNNSDDGLYLVDTGKAEYALTNEIERWNGKTILDYWTTPYANMINGTDGSFFRPYVKRDETRYMYFSDMCRSLKLEYDRDTQVKGVDTLRFHFADDLFANATVQPDNAGFCVPAGNCYDSGVVNVAGCREGAPVLLSAPHFYNAAPVYQNGVEGLSPNKQDHDSFFDVEPTSGVVFASGRKLQINIEVRPSKYITQLQSVREAVWPVLWLGGDSIMTDSVSKEFRGIMSLTKFMNGVSYLTIGIGLLCFAGVLVCFFRKNRQRKKEPLLDDCS